MDHCLDAHAYRWCFHKASRRKCETPFARPPFIMLVTVHTGIQSNTIHIHDARRLQCAVCQRLISGSIVSTASKVSNAAKTKSMKNDPRLMQARQQTRIFLMHSQLLVLPPGLDATGTCWTILVINMEGMPWLGPHSGLRARSVLCPR